MTKNTSAFGDIEISPLNGAFDLRSPSGTMPIQNFRLVLNASMNEQGKRCRRPQWRKFGTSSPFGFNNQDLHDRLEGGYTCYGGNDECTCDGTPDCLMLVDYDPDFFLDASCAAGAQQNPAAPVWDGNISRNGDACTWGFPFFTWSFPGVNEPTETDIPYDLSVILSVKSCEEGEDKVYQLSFMARDVDGNGILLWSGESVIVPTGTYTRTDGCNPTASFTLKNCEVCTQPTITESPPSGSTVASGTYISLNATFGADIFFTTDGSEPDNTSEHYTGPFQYFDEVNIKAIAYSGDCISDVYTFEYIINQDIIFEYVCDDEDQAGVFNEFAPNGSADYNWRLRFTLPEVDITRVEIYETNAQGIWVTGQAWATDSPVHPVELEGDEFSIYPLVIYDGGVKLANDYEETLITAYAAGDHEWLLYGQPFVPLVGYFKIILYYNEGGDDKVLTSVIPHECCDYYGEGYCF